MKTLIGFIFLSAFSVSYASEIFLINDWAESFAQAVKKNDTKKLDQLTNLVSLEKKVATKCVDCKSKKIMRQARSHFSKGNFIGAENLYSQIPKGSDQWLESVEERGWSYFRNDNFEKTLAQTKTLLSPQFIGNTNSEVFFLQSLALLKICDYEGILATHQLFKDKQRLRILEMQEIAKTGPNESLMKAITQIDKFPLKYENFDESLMKLPLLFYRDLEFQKNLLRLKISIAGIKIPSPYQNLFQKIQVESSLQLKNRIRELADRENGENTKIVQKLNLIEIEAIQRIHTDIGLSQNMYKENDFKKTTDDQLIFMDDGQPWIDELDKYDIATKSCNKNIRRKM